MIAPWLAAAPLLAMLGAPSAAAGGAAPIDLVVQQDRGTVRFTVRGLSDRAYAARYTLEVDGRGPAGRNHTTQGGTATLRPGEPATLLTVALASGGGGQWTATLVVTPAEGAPYRQQQASPRAASPPAAP